ncbi:transketolase [Arachidicoccus ginsenosidimutans]|uniref:alpha-ketoacid dehydrogenase subunit alpha/beta n=1 Tax=Arachidicoccus sp. BS20 TaxID=1850526 RepID=UPI0007F08C8C|nr:alpha-ketoacid dehydrogenase subunit alpha/beta [Arachidicoccus sp. BS20]ANI89417.1 transketolase [Arachidicoccus sp. BS20]
MENVARNSETEEMLSFEDFKKSVLNDFKIAVESREASLLGRREVLTGKAKFGIFGDGKEVAQVAVARFFQNGDWRSGYYRDQTLAFATGIGTIEQFFSQLYADTDIHNEPLSGGRNMVGHFTSQNMDENGNWLPLVNMKNSATDFAPTAGQMPRALGLALASKQFRINPSLKNEKYSHLSKNGNEICFTTIGDAATSEGHFWEVMNAAGVLQVPLAVFVWDDGYGISVPTSKQTTKGSISEALRGLQKERGTNGIDIYTMKGWDYAGMCETLEPAIEKIRQTHTPAVFHVQEITQPQGHSTSGSHERYKSQARLQWERDWDCIKQMKNWIVETGIATEEEIEKIRLDAKNYVKECRNRAWEKYITPLKAERQKAVEILNSITFQQNELNKIATGLASIKEPLRKDILSSVAEALALLRYDKNIAKPLLDYYRFSKKEWNKLYDKFQYDEGPKSAANIKEIKAEFSADSPVVSGYEVLNKYFDQLFANNSSVVAFGEDLGKIGDVNQGFAGLQDKHGEARIFDTGIRELSIMGKGIGLALRGLRPIAEVQYMDYLLYALEPLSDDVASLHYRTAGKQSCPIIVRTRGHRLEGMFHSGSPMGTLINSLRGFYVCVPRNMTQAAGMYNTLLQTNTPALLIESLNGYRLKEKLPANLSIFTVPLGVPETIREGADITIVSYGSVLRIIQDAAEKLAAQNISCEIIDVQTLLPFDTHHLIKKSLEKTNRILFVDEDVPGGAAAFMFNKVMEEQQGYKLLDVAPRTITGKNHKPAYGSDGDYFSKPNAEEIIDVVREMMEE